MKLKRFKGFTRLNENRASKRGMDKFTDYAKHLLRTNGFDKLLDDAERSQIRAMNVFSASKGGVRLDIELGEWDGNPYFTCAVMEQKGGNRPDEWNRTYFYGCNRASDLEPLLCGIIDIAEALVNVDEMREKFAFDTREFDSMATVEL